jgi:hypothetical protein
MWCLTSTAAFGKLMSSINRAGRAMFKADDNQVLKIR